MKMRLMMTPLSIRRIPSADGGARCGGFDPKVSAMPLMRFRPLEVLYATRLAAIWFAADPLPRLFPCVASDHRPTVPPQLLHCGFILLCRRTRSEYLHFKRPLASFNASQPAQDFAPLRGMTESSPLTRASTLASFRPQAFTASRRFTPRLGATGLFHPATTSRILPFRGFSLHAAVLSHRKALPPCRCDQPGFPSENGPTKKVPRLRGFAPHEEAFVGFGY